MRSHSAGSNELPGEVKVAMLTMMTPTIARRAATRDHVSRLGLPPREPGSSLVSMCSLNRRFRPSGLLKYGSTSVKALKRASRLMSATDVALLFTKRERGSEAASDLICDTILGRPRRLTIGEAARCVTRRTSRPRSSTAAPRRVRRSG